MLAAVVSHIYLLSSFATRERWGRGGAGTRGNCGASGSEGDSSSSLEALPHKVKGRQVESEFAFTARAL